AQPEDVVEVAPDLAGRLVRARDLPAVDRREAARHQRDLDPPTDRQLLVECLPLDDLALEPRSLDRDGGLAGNRGEELAIARGERRGPARPAENDRAVVPARRSQERPQDRPEPLVARGLHLGARADRRVLAAKAGDQRT